MPAPKGNEYWKLRKKDGREPNIKSPNEIIEAWNEYCQNCFDNPAQKRITKTRANGDVETIVEDIPKVLLKREFARACGLSEWRLLEDLKKSKDKQKAKEYSQVLTWIEGAISDMKMTYATAGIFNASIVAKDLGLVDKKEVETNLSLGNVRVITPEGDLEISN